MNGPAKNRLYGYEAGWLTMGVASEESLQAASSWSLQQF
jgi:hypothetical protein